MGPIAVLIFITNVSSMRLMLSLGRRGPERTPVPRLSSLFLGPLILYGISHVVRVYADQRPEFRAFALALETVTAVSWLLAVGRLSEIFTRIAKPRSNAGRAASREFATAATSGSFPPPTSVL